MCWIVIFGAQEKIALDRDEFNDLFVKQFNISLKPPAAESLWSNSMVKRHNAILARTIEKLVLDQSNNYVVDFIIVWVVNAKDNLHNCYGYSLNQLVYRHNPSLPSVLTNKLPVMEGSTSELLRSHFNAISDSRRVFVECEGNEELQRAIRSKLQRATC